MSNTIRLPRPILPLKLKCGEDGLCFIEESLDGGTMPTATNFSGFRDLVNNKTGSSGSCIKFYIYTQFYNKRKFDLVERAMHIPFYEAIVGHMLPSQLLSQASSKNHHQLGVYQRWILSYRRLYMQMTVRNIIWVHKFFLTWTNFTRQGWKSGECQAIIKKLSFMLENPCKPKQQSIIEAKSKQVYV